MACKSIRARLVLLRVTHEQYLRLTEQAEAAGVSVNSYVLTALGFDVPFNQAGRRGRRPTKAAGTNRFQLRMSIEQHAKLALLAEDSSLSLNSLILSLLGLEITVQQHGLPPGQKLQPRFC
jgi:predicted HicB family RNase H-like nuclease